MRNRILLIALLFSVVACDGPPAGDAGDVFSELDDYDYLPGYYDLYWDDAQGRLLIDANKLAEPFLSTRHRLPAVLVPTTSAWIAASSAQPRWSSFSAPGRSCC